MKSREEEYKEIFIAEALEYYDALSQHISNLEKNPGDEYILAEIFRLLHNLKANAKAIGYLQVSEVAHKLETAFGLIRKKELSFSEDVVPVLFNGIDLLGEMIHNVDNPEFRMPDVSLLQNLDQIVENPGEGSLGLSNVNRQVSLRGLTLSDLIYIHIKKLDHLLNLVGELIIDRDRILSLSHEIDSDDLRSVSAHLYRITDELQYSVMDARLVSIGTLFNKFPRVVRDISAIEKKQVRLEIKGQDIQIDRNILQIITDSLLHLLRNAVSHGIERESVRKKLGKNTTGTISLSAQNDRETVIIRLSDDGRGIDLQEVRKGIVDKGFLSEESTKDLRDAEVLTYLFEPGFSLAKEITEVSGRGVGLDVVKNAMDAIGGRIRIESEKKHGTTFILNLPTSIAVKGALLFEVDANYYAIPLLHTDSVVALPISELHEVGGMLVADLQDDTIAVVYLHELLNTDPALMELGDKRRLRGAVQNIIIVSYNNRKVGLIVDKLIRQQDIVVKPLNPPVDKVDIYSGVTLLGTGKVCLVLDVMAITRYIFSRKEGR
jgi:two-component system, chemotaxis family, sensor kinase CheA